jgi:hypothetical protein
MSEAENLIRELRELREPYSYSPSLGGRAALALESLSRRLASAQAVIEKVREESARGQEHGSDSVDALILDGILDAVPSGVLAEVKADAWDEGYDHGASWSPAAETYPERTDNPYRREGTDE